jgi:Ca2+-binding RTX toxin-like protein
MASVFISTTQSGAGIQADLTTDGEGVYLMAGVGVSSTGTLALYGRGNNHAAYIDGIVVGQTDGIQLGSNSATNFGSRLTIGETGKVVGMYGDGAKILGTVSTVVIDGTIEGVNAGLWYSAEDNVPPSSTSFLTNTGLIRGGSAGIQRFGNETFQLDNSGTITGPLSFFAQGDGSDTVNNSGTMNGSILLGGGNDFYNGFFGKVVGAIFGGDGTDIINGGTAADLISGDAGADTMAGGAGSDIYFLETVGDIVIEALNEGNDQVNYSGTGGETYVLPVNVENLSILAASLANGSGNTLKNTIGGSSVANILNGRLGNDTLSGGLGNDFFVFNTAPNAATNRDRILDFNEAGNDTIRLENTGVGLFNALAAGQLAAAAYTENASGAATAATHRIIYETDTGQLRYDSNGSLAGGVILNFATIDANRQASMSHLDFFVI